MTPQRINEVSVTPGSYAVAEAPGLGLTVDEEAFQGRYASNEVKVTV